MIVNENVFQYTTVYQGQTLRFLWDGSELIDVYIPKDAEYPSAIVRVGVNNTIDVPEEQEAFERACNEWLREVMDPAELAGPSAW